ncbi:hypothetical protein [Streptomyces sp. NPDC048277]|uniref:hypothetical protein n=1 Tax=Streptomyces sp. NPDC048277 TaxID=3155027 RepID=UPI0033FD5730
MTACGWTPVAPEGVGLRISDGSAGFSGVSTCGSAWACPRCSAKISAARFEEVRAILEWARKQGYTCGLLTLTMQHKKSDPLADLLEGQLAAWARVTRTERWTGEKPEKYAERLAKWEEAESRGFVGKDGIARPRPRPDRRIGLREITEWTSSQGVTSTTVDPVSLIGFVRVIEVMHGDSGWHPHQHMVVIFDGNVTTEQAETWRKGIFERWRESLQAEGYTARATVRQGGMIRNVGADLRLLRPGQAEEWIAGYFTKQLAMEATLGHSKKGKGEGGSRAPFEIARHAVARTLTTDEDGITTVREPDQTSARLWWEYEKATKARHRLRYSEGLRKMAGLEDEEQSDEDIAAEDLGTEDLVRITNMIWIGRHGGLARRGLREVAPEVLDLARRRGLLAVLDFLTEEGFPHTVTGAGWARLGLDPPEPELLPEE